MLDAEVQTWRPDRDRMMWLCGSMVLVMIPHTAHVPVWVGLSFALFALWRFAHAMEVLRLPSRWARVALSLAMTAGVYASYGTLLGRDSGVALLVGLTGMKLLETERLRDAYVVNFLGYFLVISNFLFSQSLRTGLYMLAVVLALTATLIAITVSKDEIAPLRRVRIAGGMLLQSVPIMLIAFVLFPRVQGPLWGLPADTSSATSGLSDHMSPGNISRLGRSDAIAFRVKFEGAPPPQQQLYWRGPVFWRSDGRTWSRGRPTARASPSLARTRGQAIEYTLTLEPHHRRWLFALDVPGSAPPGTTLSDDYRLLSNKAVDQRRRYRLQAFPNYRLGGFNDARRRAALALPTGAHARAVTLAREWRAEVGHDEAVMRRALDYFRTEAFYYTLTPPLLDGDSVDEFLFGTRRGFCEHYAAAFTVLMRAAGIPARVVTGYQGGELNPFGDYWIVRQRDAHAWAEVWLPEQGWRRVDPTAAVSPLRIEQGMEAALPSEIGPALISFTSGDTARRAWQRLRHGLDAISNAWNQWVLGYGPERQRQLLSRLGFEDVQWRDLGLALMFCVIALLGAVAGWILRPSPSAGPETRAYRTFCRRLARRGVERRAVEGPADFARRAEMLRPELGEQVRHITGLYVALRYGGATVGIRELRRAVAGFRP